ncbi:MAG: hypothetical protein SPE43_03660 [Ruminococcus sp.]|nr:hypothetical protein [Oscillospiraceae bacterium]MDY4413455.1 hypothetical protein [Ruminococcus sp.]
MEDNIYIIVAQTGTNVAKAIKFFTKKPYNHVSVSGDIELSKMYSFCRTYRYTPLPATFNEEIIGKGTLGLFSNIPCEIYQIHVSHEQKKHFEKLIRNFHICRNEYSYNILGLIAIYLNISWDRKSHFLCSQFVAHIFSEIGINLKKKPCLYTPEDFRHLSDAQLIYKGELNDWHKRKYPAYSDNSSYSMN